MSSSKKTQRNGVRHEGGSARNTPQFFERCRKAVTCLFQESLEHHGAIHKHRSALNIDRTCKAHAALSVGENARIK